MSRLPSLLIENLAPVLRCIRRRVYLIAVSIGILSRTRSPYNVKRLQIQTDWDSKSCGGHAVSRIS